MVYSQKQIQNILVQAANKYGIPPQYILAIAQHESGFRPEVNNAGLNKNGSTDWGLMQLNDITLKTYGLTTEQALDPVINAEYGAKLFADNLRRFGGDVNKAVWGYAAGPGNVKGTPNAAIQKYQNFVAGYVPSGDLGIELVPSPSPSPSPFEFSSLPPDESVGSSGEWEGSESLASLWPVGDELTGEDWGIVAVVGLLAVGAYIVLS